MQLIEPIATYFRAKNIDDPSRALDCFSPTAVVVDSGENMEMNGHDAIGSWLNGTVAKYNLKTNVTNVVDKDGETVVTALVSGDFPGSPIEFDYYFVVRDGKIQRLVIR